MKIVFTGGMPGGEILCPGAKQTIPFTRGEPVEVPADSALELIKAGDWKAADKTKAAPKAAAK